MPAAPDRYRVGRRVGTTIYRRSNVDGYWGSQPIAWVPDDPVLAGRIVALLNAGASNGAIAAALHALRSYENGNDAPELAKEAADALEAAIGAFEL